MQSLEKVAAAYMTEIDSIQGVNFTPLFSTFHSSELYSGGHFYTLIHKLFTQMIFTQESDGVLSCPAAGCASNDINDSI